MDRDARLIYDGIELQFGDVMFHGLGDRFHQRTMGACHWGSVSVTPAFLKTAAMTVAGQVLVPPSIRQLLHPRRADHRLLLRRHAAAARMVETAPTHIGHKEVIRAIEQDLILALVNCLTADEAKPVERPRLWQPSKLTQFEAMLSAEPYRLPRTQDVCEAIGMSSRALRESCSKLLGMSPLCYQRLRRLKRVRAELMRQGVAVDIAEILARYGFPDLPNFVADYWDAFGEMPPIPPRRAVDR
jgi:AraC-like DNA-binding protein